MTNALDTSQQLLDVLVQAIIVIVPILISWFVRTYVRSSSAEREIATVVQLSNAAINYVENLDQRGDLVLPADVAKGAQKLGLASEWLVTELKRSGINVSEAEAKKWVAAEFQKRTGGLTADTTLGEVTSQAIGIIQRLEARELVEMPPGTDRNVYLTELAADWITDELSKRGSSIGRETALSLIRAETLRRLDQHVGAPLSSLTLAELAGEATAFVASLGADGLLSVSPEDDGSTEQLVALAWLRGESGRRGLMVTDNELADAVASALARQRPS